MSSLLSHGFYFSIFIVTVQLHSCQQLINVISSEQFEDAKEASLCLSIRPNGFLFSSSIQSNGCSILCEFLNFSSIKLLNYYDAITVISHSLPEKTPCKNDSYCFSNICTHRDDFPGIAKLFIEHGYFPGQDAWTPTDTYIKVYSESKLSGLKYIGRTKTIHNNDKPNFYQTFETKISSKEGCFILRIFDYDSDSTDDLIARVKIKFNDCPKGFECTKKIGKFYLKFTEEWIPQI